MFVFITVALSCFFYMIMIIIQAHVRPVIQIQESHICWRDDWAWREVMSMRRYVCKVLCLKGCILEYGQASVSPAWNVFLKASNLFCFVSFFFFFILNCVSFASVGLILNLSHEDHFYLALLGSRFKCKFVKHSFLCTLK